MYIYNQFDDLIIKQQNDASGNPIYTGQATPGTADSVASWRICKWTWDGNNAMLTRLFADGSVRFDKEWDERANYTYK